MTSPFLVPFRAEHLFTFVPRTDIPKGMLYGLEKERGGPAFTGVHDGRIIGCAGVVIQWPGVGAAWVALDKSAEAHGFWVTRMIKRIMQDIVRVYGLHRVEAVVHADSPRDLKWIKLLGFKSENDVAQMYTEDKRDIVRFEWLP